MRNPGYVHELAARQLSGTVLSETDFSGVCQADLDAAAAALAPLSAWQRRELIRSRYVADALEKGYATGDPAGESTWILSQLARSFYSRKRG